MQTPNLLEHINHSIHANFVVWQGMGILITGPSGSGKSTLSWQLIQCGAYLVADDLVHIEKDCGQLIGSLPNPQFTGLIYLRDQGVLNLQTLSIGTQVLNRYKICMHIHLA